jgi:hypothetical protein
LALGFEASWAAPLLQTCDVAHWGDLDTWGMTMLATARRHLPQVVGDAVSGWLAGAGAKTPGKQCTQKMGVHHMPPISRR